MVRITVIDIECDSLNWKVCNIVEFGYAHVEDINSKWVITKSDGVVIKPSRVNPNAWIFKNSSLTLEEIKEEGLPIAEFPQYLEDIFESTHYLAGFNIEGYDWKVLSKFYQHNVRIMDLMKLFTPITKIPRYEALDDDAGPIEYKWPKMVECLSKANIIATELHRAESDAKLEAQLLLYLLETTVESLDRLVTQRT